MHMTIADLLRLNQRRAADRTSRLGRAHCFSAYHFCQLTEGIDKNCKTSNENA